ncbi:MAG TPA: hypothetical protein VM597_37640 [Gemmataceae bacterium]|nr:hypothetical protein [Gemmataceae bacterium]
MQLMSGKPSGLRLATAPDAFTADRFSPQDVEVRMAPAGAYERRAGMT